MCRLTPFFRAKSTDVQNSKDAMFSIVYDFQLSLVSLKTLLTRLVCVSKNDMRFLPITLAQTFRCLSIPHLGPTSYLTYKAKAWFPSNAAHATYATNEKKYATNPTNEVDAR